MRYIFVAVALALALGLSPARAQQDDVVVLDQSKPIVAKFAGRQRFVDYVDLKDGQEKLPLTMTFTNGPVARFQWLRVSIAGRPFLTEQDFKGGTTMTLDMTRDLGAGSSQIVVMAGGPAGATVSWRLTTPKVKLSAVKPDKAQPGEELTLSGFNFARNPSDNAVLLDSKQLQPSDGTTRSLQVKLPLDAQPGKTKVSVAVFGMSSNAVDLEILPKPLVTSVNPIRGPAGTEVTITGKGFSPRAQDNKVLIGGMPAEVSASSQTSLTATIPAELDAQSPIFGVPVIVEVKGVKSNDDVTLDVDSRVVRSDEAI